MTIKKAKKRRQEFNARGSKCPLCKQLFRSCGHSIIQAYDRLDKDYTVALIRNTTGGLI